MKTNYKTMLANSAEEYMHYFNQGSESIFFPASIIDNVLEALEKSKDVDIRHLLMHAYFCTLYRKDKEEESKKLIKNLAEKGEPEAYLYYAIVLAGENKNDESKKYLLKSIKETDRLSNYINLGILYLKSKEEDKNKKAYECFKAAFDPEFITSIYYLGKCYLDGIGVKKDFNKAIQYIEKAAESKHFKALVKLGIIYEDGIPEENFKADKNKAFSYYLEASKYSSSVGEFYLGWAYYYGVGVNTNFPEALKHFLISYEHGYKYGKIYAAIVNLRISKDKKVLNDAIKTLSESDKMGLSSYYLACFYNGQFNKDYHNDQLAFKYCKQAAEAGSRSAANLLGNFYTNGVGTDVDTKLARYWYELYASEGDGAINYNLALNYRDAGEYQKAFKLFKKTYEGGYIHAATYLGIMCFHGEGVAVDYLQSYLYFCDGAKSGDKLAHYYLGYLYEVGEVVDQSDAIAAYHYNMAALQDHEDAKKGLERIKAKGTVLYISGDYEEIADQLYAYGTLNNNYEKSVEYYFKSIEKDKKTNKGSAYHKIARAYYRGQGVIKDDKEAFSWCKKSAEAGNAAGMNDFGFYYLEGIGTEVDYLKAYKWFYKASNDSPTATNNLGYMYHHGLGMEPDLDKAIEYYESAAKRGSKNATKHLQEEDIVIAKKDKDRRDQINKYLTDAKALYDNKKYKEAIQKYEEASKLGSSDGLYHIAMMTLEGEGVKQNKEHAIEILKELGNKNHTDALYALGHIYQYGDGVPVNKELALDYYKKAADTGNTYCQYLYGAYCLCGTLGIKKYKEAYLYSKAAAEKGYKHAYYYLGEAYYFGYGVKQDYQKAIYCYEKDSYDPDTAYSLGYIYEHGKGVEIDGKKAATYYQNSAAYGNNDARVALAMLYKKGKIIAQNLFKAFDLLQSAAEENHPQGMFEYGKMLYYGEGCSKNHTQAEYYITESSKLGIEDAKTFLENNKFKKSIFDKKIKKK